MRVTSKGQIKIPQDIREESGILPGTEVECALVDGQVIVRRKPGAGRGEALIRLMTGAGSVKLTTDEIMQMTRGDR